MRLLPVKKNIPDLERNIPLKFVKTCSYCGQDFFYFLSPEDEESLARKELSRLLLDHMCNEKKKAQDQSELDRLWSQVQTP
jgi:hypothetical protein